MGPAGQREPRRDPEPGETQHCAQVLSGTDGGEGPTRRGQPAPGCRAAVLILGVGSRTFSGPPVQEGPRLDTATQPPGGSQETLLALTLLLHREQACGVCPG